MRNVTSSYSNLLSIICFMIFAISSVFLYSNNILAQQKEVVIFFDSDTNSISEGGLVKLRQTAESLNNTSDYTITLEGYSDITGKADYNLELSANRAELVKDYLVELGLRASQMTVIGKGGAEKYGVGETNEALQANRRVNLIVVVSEEPEVEVETPEPLEPEENITEPDQDNAIAESSNQDDLEPAQPISRKRVQNIEKKIRENASQSIDFITPREMQVGQTYNIEAQVEMSFLETLSENLPGMKLQNKLGLILTGNKFDIALELENDSNIQVISKNAPSVWRWRVTPISAGYGSLGLSVELLPSSTDGSVNPDFATFQRVIDIKPNLVHSITSSYWIMGALIVLIIVIVAWVLVRKVRVD